MTYSDVILTTTITGISGVLTAIALVGVLHPDADRRGEALEVLRALLRLGRGGPE